MAKDDRVNVRGEIKRKLVESKERWARQGRLLTGLRAEGRYGPQAGRPGDPQTSRLPPGQRAVRDWPVLDLGVKPQIDLASWRLVVDGLVANPVTWSWSEFLAQPQLRIVSDIHCVTAWSRFENLWEGVGARHLIQVVAPKPEARFIVFHGYDGYTTNVRRGRFEDEDVLLAHSWQGEPIPAEHGGPVRVVIPKLYFWKSAKWIRRIEFAASDHPGFWEVRGYHNEGDPWEEERYGRSG